MSNFSLTSTPAHPARNHVDKLDNLQKDMLDALAADQVKEQINDAKLRAVKQRVEYDEFEKLVQGAHLRPIKPKSDTLNGVCKSFDGFVMPKHEPKPAGPAPPPRVAVADALPPPPKTSNEFTRVWKRQCKTPAARAQYLRSLDTETLPLIFRTELDPSLFDGFVATLGEVCLATPSGGAAAPPAAADDAAVDLSDLDGDDAAAAAPNADLEWAFALLDGVHRLNRFDLTLDFADKAALATLGALFDAMAGALDAERVAALRAAYKA